MCSVKGRDLTGDTLAGSADDATATTAAAEVSVTPAVFLSQNFFILIVVVAIVWC